MFIKEHRKQYRLKLLCEVLKVSASGYHKWLKRKVSQRAIENQRLLERIKYHYRLGRGSYGLPRILAALRKEEMMVNKKRIARLMRINRIRAKTKRKFKVTTLQNTKAKASENILKGRFDSQEENRIWTSDITYLWTKQGWLYLAVVMDVYSRKIVGWSLGSSLSAELVTRALLMALLHRKPGGRIIFHSDRGSQYTSSQLRELLKSYKITQSMSSTGNCYDNAITESFFHTLKTELVYWNHYQSREEAKRSIFEYIEIFYNRQRLHSALNYLSPVEFEERNLKINRKDLIEKVA